MSASSSSSSSSSAGATLAASKEERVKRRWNILRSAIQQALGAAPASAQQGVDSVISVRRFERFGLILKEPAPQPPGQSGKWLRYFSADPALGFSAVIRERTEVITLEEMIGFNNTGNVCVWPSEEILAYYCLKHEDLIGRRVCELGAGMAALAGFAAAKCARTEEVHLTDGNEQSVENIAASVPHNITEGKDTRLTSGVLVWDRTKDLSALGKFDTILCADCLFFEKVHEDLLFVLDTLLAEGGNIIILAPKRGDTFDKFRALAETRFQVRFSDKYDDLVWELHEKALADPESHYDPNLHYPQLMHLTHGD